MTNKHSNPPLDLKVVNQFTDISIDLETLAVETHNPAILSIGLVLFHAENDPTKISPRLQFYWEISIEDAMRWGQVHANTIQWWMQPGNEKGRELFNTPDDEKYTLAGALREMAQVIYQYASPYARVWTNGPAQDDTWLRSAYYRLDIQLPWTHGAGRDIRTIREFLSKQAQDIAADGLLKHHALHDAIWASRLVEIFYGAHAPTRGGDPHGN